MREGKKEQKEYYAQAAFICGEAFQRLAAGFIPKIGVIKETSAQAMSNELGDLIACATNLGFAIELFLKALLTQLDLPVPKSHNLRALYDTIPQSVQTLIQDVYDMKWPEQLHLLPHHSFTLAMGPLEEPRWDVYKVSPSLPDLLARSGDIFQSWRYVFEFHQPEDNPYQFHQFEYGLLWCAAEAIRVELMVRLRGMGETLSTNSSADEP